MATRTEAVTAQGDPTVLTEVGAAGIPPTAVRAAFDRKHRRHFGGKRLTSVFRCFAITVSATRPVRGSRSRHG